MIHTITSDTLVLYKGRYYTGTDIKAMREWISDCQWGDIDDDSELTDFQVIQGVDDNVHGGLSEFINNML